MTGEGENQLDCFALDNEMLKLLGCSRLTGLRLTSAMALPFCRQAPPSARNPQVLHDDMEVEPLAVEGLKVKNIAEYSTPLH